MFDIYFAKLAFGALNVELKWRRSSRSGPMGGGKYHISPTSRMTSLEEETDNPAAALLQAFSQSASTWSRFKQNWAPSILVVSVRCKPSSRTPAIPVWLHINTSLRRVFYRKKAR